MRPNAILNSSAPSSPQLGELALGDTRFRALLTAGEWRALSPEVRARFSKRIANGKTSLYAGEVVEAEFSLAGWLFAQAARLIGGPLPLHAETGVPAIVSVTEDVAAHGQVWTRMYASRRGFPQVINTSKRFRGSTGLQEYLGCGIGMALKVYVENGAIVFSSAGYFFEAFGRQWRLPTMVCPGRVTVTHAEIGPGRFSFTLLVEHPWLGVLIRQTVNFREIVQ
jgi:hypothetical protein